MDFPNLRLQPTLAMLVLPTVFLFPTALIAQTGPPVEKVDAIFAEWDKPGSPGCALGVIRDGELIYKKGYGMASLDWDVPITPSTVFYVGSVSKQFTATSIALLARAGKLSLDDDIREYLPQMPAYETPVTIRNLIHHTSGVRDLYAVMNLKGLKVADVFPDPEALELLAGQTTLNFKPGAEFLYSNGGYFLLSEIVERASGMTFDEFTQENIFGPLGMKDSHFHNDPSHIVKHRAMSYESGEHGGFAQNYLSNFNKVGPGGLYTTVEDLLQWDRNYYDNEVGGEGFTDYMLERGVLNNGDTLDYAFALRHMEYQGLKVIDHGGGFMGFRADLVRFPEQRLSVACLCNLSGINPSQLTRQVADLYLADHFSRHLKGYAGLYRNEDLDVAYDITFRDGALYLNRPGAPEGRLIETEAGKFRVYGFWNVEFVRDTGDRLREFTVDVGRARGVHFVSTARIAATQ